MKKLTRLVILAVLVLAAFAAGVAEAGNVRIRLARLGWEDVLIVNCTIPGHHPHYDVLPDTNWRVWCDLPASDSANGFGH